MIKYECSESLKSLEVRGNLTEISTDVVMLIRIVYATLKEKNEDAAEAFADGCKYIVGKGIIFDDMEELLKELREITKDCNDNKNEDSVEKLKTILKDMLEELS